MIPKISVIFPVGEREAFLKEAIESILKQSLGDFELAIVLDGVSDAIKQIVYSYKDPRINITSLPVNMGISAARNAALRIATAPLIALMDSDDVALPERFQRQHDWMCAHPDVTVTGTNAIKLLREGGTAPMKYPETDAMIKSRLFLVDGAVLNPTAMLRREFMSKYKLQYDSNFPRDEDHRLYVEMMRHGATFYGIQEELLLYRRHGANSTTDQTGKDWEKSRVRELILPIFFPELSGSDYKVLLKGMHENCTIGIAEACHFITASDKALLESRTFVGEDRHEIRRILGFYQQRMLQILRKPATQ